jgi:hypothetical protein
MLGGAALGLVAGERGCPVGELQLGALPEGADERREVVVEINVASDFQASMNRTARARSRALVLAALP